MGMGCLYAFEDAPLAFRELVDFYLVLLCAVASGAAWSSPGYGCFAPSAPPVIGCFSASFGFLV